MEGQPNNVDTHLPIEQPTKPSHNLISPNVEDGISSSTVVIYVFAVVFTLVTSVVVWLSIYSVPFSQYYEDNYYVSALLFVLCVALQLPFIALGGIYWTRGILGLPLQLWSRQTWIPILLYSVATISLYLGVSLMQLKNWPTPFLPLWGIGSLYFVTVIPSLLLQIDSSRRKENRFLRQFIVASSVTGISNIYYFILLAFYLAISWAEHSPILQILTTIIFFWSTRIFYMARAKAILSSGTAHNFNQYHMLGFLLLNIFELTASAEIYFSIASPLLEPWNYAAAKVFENVMLMFHLFQSKLPKNTPVGNLILRLKHMVGRMGGGSSNTVVIENFEYDMGRYIIFWLCEAFGHIFFIMAVPYLYYFSPNSKWFLFSYSESRLNVALLQNLVAMVALLLNFVISHLIIKRKFKRDLLRFGVFVLRQPVAKTMFPALCVIAPAHIFCQLGYHWEVVSYLQRGL